MSPKRKAGFTEAETAKLEEMSAIAASNYKYKVLHRLPVSDLIIYLNKLVILKTGNRFN